MKNLFRGIFAAMSILMLAVFPSAAQQPVITQMSPETVSKVDALESNVATLAADLPVDLPSIGAITSFVYNRPANQVVMTIRFTNPALEDAIKISVDGMRQGFANVFSADLRQITESVYDVGGSIAMRFTDANNGVLNEFVYTKADLKNILNAEQVSEKDKIRQILADQYKVIKAQLPIDQGDGTVLVDTWYDNGTVAYCYEVDESVVDMDSLKVENILQASKYDQMARAVFSRFKTGEITVIYKYKGKNSGREVKFQITPDQM